MGAVNKIEMTTVDSESGQRAKNSMPKGESLTHCEECDGVIPS